MSSARRAFVIMPFGKKKLADGTEVDCDDIYKRLLAPAITAAGLEPHRADADRRGGSIHLDMFQDLLLAEFVVADLTMDNPNVWYEIGVRHALRAGGTVMTYAARDRLPFDIAGQRMQRYTLKEGKLDPAALKDERKAITEAIEATLGAWRGRRASPVYQTIPSLKEPDWKTLKVGDVNEYWEALENWQRRVEVARRKQRPGDILVLAEETSNSLLEFEALRTAAKALLDLKRPLYALSILEKAEKLDPDDVKARQLKGMALGRANVSPRRAMCWARSPRSTRTARRRPLRAHLEGRVDAGLECASEAPGRPSRRGPRYRRYPAERRRCLLQGVSRRPGGLLSRHQCADVGAAVGARHRSQEQARAGCRRGGSWVDRRRAIERSKDYWSLATRAEMALVENRATRRSTITARRRPWRWRTATGSRSIRHASSSISSAHWGFAPTS